MNTSGGTRLPGLGHGGRSFYTPVAYANLDLPVRVTEVGESWWAFGDSHARTCSPIWALELVRNGSLLLEQDGRSQSVDPGQGFILKRGSRHSYRSGKRGVRKSYIGLDGTAVEVVLQSAPDVIQWRDPRRAMMLFRRIRQHVERRQADWQALASAEAYNLLIEVARSGASRDSRERHAVLERVLPLLEAPYGHTCRIHDIAQRAGISQAQLHRIFLEELKTTPRQYANAFAMRRAQDALRSTTSSCAAIAAELGYDPHYFSAVFRRLVGMSPQAFRAQHH